MPHLSVADVLQLPVVRQGGPVVLAGHAGLERPLRWVHATELADIAPLLRPGDLVLTTGVGLPADDALGDFARSLHEAECAGLIVEYGRRWYGSLPAALVGACGELDLPLVALTHETRFAAVIQTVGELVVDRQLAELRDAERVHETFTELSSGEAGPAEVLDAVGRLAAAPVVLENEQHRPLDFRPGPDGSHGFLDGWPARSARVVITGRTGWDEGNGWLVTRLGTRERSWGRLVIGSPERPPQRLVAVAERAAASLALHRLHDRDRDNLTRRRHHELLVTLQAGPPSDEVLRRCELAGLPVERRRFAGLVFRPARVGAGRPDLDDVVASVVHSARVPVLVCEIDREVRVLVSMPHSADEGATIDRLAERVAQRHAVVACAGRAVSSPDSIDRTLLEARQVADSLSTPGQGPRVHRLEDVHLRGLLTLLGTDDRLRLFVDRELRALREYDATAAAPLTPVLRALLEHPAGKSTAAAALHLSRAAFYDRLARLQKVLGLDLDDPGIRVSLHVALVADELARRRPEG
ncbi:PucR family transcriptional regulator [Kineosporia succinea]|uniref:Purine catabolism regulator n=1 Tax=Kineosporia succinea TaxID=84632 RepID=A0ABT9P9M6_9ACTN|nr:PucR family transcriptional regulator ligand-binding domain-containing protein [Kineosporia succinea]MDP9828870.1 purine catabolism regulator [Kineosporia succinea]